MSKPVRKARKMLRNGTPRSLVLEALKNGLGQKKPKKVKKVKQPKQQ